MGEYFGTFSCEFFLGVAGFPLMFGYGAVVEIFRDERSWEYLKNSWANSDDQPAEVTLNGGLLRESPPKIQWLFLVPVTGGR